jgi:hypothetical protein
MAAKRPASFDKILQPLFEGYRFDRASLLDTFIRYCSIRRGGFIRVHEFDTLDAAVMREVGQTHFVPAYEALVNQMKAHPFSDFLGPWYMDTQSKSTKQARGEFYTPQAVSDMMAMMTIGDPEAAVAEHSPKRPLTFLDPCCGSGTMGLSIAKVMRQYLDRIHVTAVDVNPLAIDMAYFNFTSSNVPALLVLGDSLAMRFTKSIPTPAMIGMLEGKETHPLLDNLPEPTTHSPSPALVKQLEMQFAPLAKTA